jgi:hypothetical protein
MKKFLSFFLIILLSADIIYSFLQFYHTPFDGDMAGGIVPAEDVTPILENPLGWKVFKDHNPYPNPNKSFCHLIFYKYFNSVPLLLQKFVNPIDSAYLSCAIAKIIIQIVIIFFLALAISGDTKFKFNFLLAAVLITPIFQTNGYRSYMGIIDPATTYTFFYALPTIFILIYFTPLFLKKVYNIEFKWFKYIKILWLPLALISSLSGPLNPGISLVVSLLLFISCFIKGFKSFKNDNLLIRCKLALKNIPTDYWYYLIPICLFSGYSLYLGRFNTINMFYKTSLLTLYSRLPEGLFYSFFQKLGFPVLFLILLINSIIIKKKFKNNEEGNNILKVFKWIGIFSLIYILLLPLGGYRNYRPYILRYDTIIPITLSLMFIYGKTSLFILKNLTNKQRIYYLPIIIMVLFIFTNSDEPEFDKNACERDALVKISQSTEQIVKLDNNCTVLSWLIIDDPQDSKLNAKLLKKWKITDREKLYYYSSPGNNQ